MGYKLPVLPLHFDGIKIFAYFLYAVGVAHGNNGTGYFIRSQVQVVYGPSGINDQFRLSNTAHIFGICCKKSGKKLYICLPFGA
jgi:hypothetical protein